MSGDPRPPVACELTPDEEQERRNDVQQALSTKYENSENDGGSVTITFGGVIETLPAVAAFVEAEHECCPFADYQVKTTPPYETTELTITGPDGTGELFHKELVNVLK